MIEPYLLEELAEVYRKLHDLCENHKNTDIYIPLDEARTKVLTTLTILLKL